MTKAELLKKVKELNVDVPPELMQKLNTIEVEEDFDLSPEYLAGIAGGAGVSIEDILDQMKKFL
ncbi:MAG: hypothetical protein IKI37_01940 [Oscillospiraceae bacterium]|nr:hypothetical protein [Oscillospiraceae bacterium]MBR7083928.1 hypothetical protein [Oscillospiraceae bacterium]